MSKHVFWRPEATLSRFYRVSHSKRAITVYLDLYLNGKSVFVYFVDLLRCESLNSLDSAACGRVLQKNYR